MKLDKERVNNALNLFADSLRVRGKEDLAFMIENFFPPKTNPVTCQCPGANSSWDKVLSMRTVSSLWFLTFRRISSMPRGSITWKMALVLLISVCFFGVSAERAG